MAKSRMPISVEFLNKLKAISGVEQINQFAERCGKHATNMTGYLSGTRNPGDGVLRDCVQHAFEWEVKPLQEVQEIPERQGDLSDSAGVYILYDSAGNVLYVGKASNFRNEVRQTLARPIPVGMRFGPKMNRKRPQIWELAMYLSLYEIESRRLRHNVEALLIRVFINQTHNSNIGHFT